MSLRNSRGISHLQGAICLTSASELERMTCQSDVKDHDSLPTIVHFAYRKVVMRHRLDIVESLGGCSADFGSKVVLAHPAYAKINVGVVLGRSAIQEFRQPVDKK